MVVVGVEVTVVVCVVVVVAVVVGVDREHVLNVPAWCAPTIVFMSCTTFAQLASFDAK